MAWLIHAGAETGATEGPMKSRRTKKPVAVAESKDAPTGRQSAVLHEQEGERSRATWRSSTIIDDDWTRGARQRGRMKDAILPHWQKPVAESKYKPTDYERAVLAKQ